MRLGLLASLFLSLSLPRLSWAEDSSPNHVQTVKGDDGWKVQVDGEDFFIYGMNWGYVPIGTNYSYNVWAEDDETIRELLSREMGLLQGMGVNAIRMYPGIPTRWVTWIYDNYGIMTMINPLVGRYGASIDGRWVPGVDYSDSRTREVLIANTLREVEPYIGTRGILCWLLGNESNYGLSWSSFEIENLPEGERDAARARYLYSLFGEITDRIHALDSDHPVALANGDLQYIDLIVEEMPSLDIMASNVYRGRSARDLFDVVSAKLDLPFFFSEFGADAYNARMNREDHLMQAGYLLDQWQEIYEHAAGHGRAQNAVGGFIFQWSDGWWKYKQEENLDVHDTNASWANRGYPEDYVEDGNNMNEEWFGIAAKGETDQRGQFQVYPRSAYYALQQAFTLDPYEDFQGLSEIQSHFDDIDPRKFVHRYQSDLLSRDVESLNRAVVANARVDLSTFSTTTHEAEGEGKSRLDFDHTESFYVDVAVRPTKGLRARLSLNVLGNVATNPIDEIFWEGRGRPAPDDTDPLATDGQDIARALLDRLRIYRGGFTWENKWFSLEGYFREGHNHWGYEGDVWGLYREAFYGPAIDTYAADVPLGIEFAGKGPIEGLRLAFGPQVYWGANPAIFGLYKKTLGEFTLSVGHQEDITSQNSTTTSSAIPEQVTRKSTIYMGWKRGDIKLDVAGLMAGTDRLGRTYRQTKPAAGETSYADSGYDVLEDKIRLVDTLGAKANLQFATGPVEWMIEGGYQGLVADAGADPRQLFTGWRLRAPGRGNHWHAQLGAAIRTGAVTIAPNILYQKPLVGPIVPISDQFSSATGRYAPGLVARNVRDNPFAVLENRETLGFELMLTFDPTPGSWMWAWDNEQREDAVVAGWLDFVYRMQPTSTDGQFGFTQDGTLFNFLRAPVAQDVWDAELRLLFNPGRQVRLITQFYAGQGQSTGEDDRLVTRYGGDLRLWWKSLRLQSYVKIDDWGPYDYYRTFNLTFPLQVGLDVSGGIGKPRPFLPSTRFGVALKYRTLDEFSPDFEPNLIDPSALGYGFELRSYITVML